MASLAELRSEARKLGIAPSVVRNASTARELREIIEDFTPNGSTKKSTAKKAVKKAVVKKSTPKPGTARRGRPPGSKNKPKVTARHTASKSAPAKSTTSRATTGKAKRQTAASSNGGRNMLGKVNYSRTDGWHPRDGSAPDRIVKALKRFKGDRDKVFNFLKADVWDFCSRHMRNGDKRKLRGAAYGAEEMLRYRIARTDWDFAVRTGQHDPSEDRVEYGTGGTGEGIFKPARKAPVKKAPVKSTTKRSTSTRASKTAAPRRGRPPGSKNKPKVATTTRAKASATAPKRRGRPPGSKTRAKR